MEELLTNVIGLEVFNADGAYYGKVVSITGDVKSGRAGDVVVDAADDANTGAFKMDSDGNLRIPFARVQSVKDHVVVSRADGGTSGVQQPGF